MLWDARVWSFFLWLVATCFYLGGFATPYPMPGNRIDVMIAFGGDVIPGGERLGLWKNIPDEISGAVLGVQAVLCVGVVAIVISFISYILLCKINKSFTNILAVVSQLVAGILALVGIGIFAAVTDKLGEGFWMVACAGGLFIINGLVLIFMPCMEYQVPKWKTEEDVPLTQTPKA